MRRSNFGSFGSPRRPGRSRGRLAHRPALVGVVDRASQRFRIEVVLGEFEYTARTLLVVEAATGDDDGGAEIEAGFKPARMAAEPIRQQRYRERRQVLPQFVVREV